MSTLKLFLLGPPRVELDGTPVDLQRRKALTLLIYLAISGRPHSRDALAALFWPDHTQSQARAYLRRDLAVLNTRLAIGAKRLQSTYIWARGFLLQELNLFEQAKADYSQAIALARQTHAGDWLPRLQADFAISQLRLGNLEVELELQAALANALRHKIEIHATRCLEGLAELALAKGEPHQALNYAEQLWQLAERHDLREIMARALRWRGVALLALEQFEAAATALQQALEMAEVYGRIRLVWQVHAALAHLYRTQGQAEKAVDHDAQVQKIVRRIAANLHVPELWAGLPLTGTQQQAIG